MNLQRRYCLEVSSRCFHYHFHRFLTAGSYNTILLQSSCMPKHATPDRREQINQIATVPSKVCRPRRPGHFSLQTADVSPRSSPLRDVLREGTSATQRQKYINIWLFKFERFGYKIWFHKFFIQRMSLSSSTAYPGGHCIFDRTTETTFLSFSFCFRCYQSQIVGNGRFGK